MVRGDWLLGRLERRSSAAPYIYGYGGISEGDLVWTPTTTSRRRFWIFQSCVLVAWKDGFVYIEAFVPQKKAIC